MRSLRLSLLELFPLRIPPCGQDKRIMTQASDVEYIYSICISIVFRSHIIVFDKKWSSQLPNNFHPPWRPKHWLRNFDPYIRNFITSHRHKPHYNASKRDTIRTSERDTIGIIDADANVQSASNHLIFEWSISCILQRTHQRIHHPKIYRQEVHAPNRPRR